VSTTFTETRTPATADRIDAIRRRIREGYYTRPEVRRTLAELLRLSLLRARRSGNSRPPKSA
jgi:hypothetical protein